MEGRSGKDCSALAVAWFAVISRPRVALAGGYDVLSLREAVAVY